MKAWGTFNLTIFPQIGILLRVVLNLLVMKLFITTQWASRLSTDLCSKADKKYMSGRCFNYSVQCDLLRLVTTGQVELKGSSHPHKMRKEGLLIAGQTWSMAPYW